MQASPPTRAAETEPSGPALDVSCVPIVREPGRNSIDDHQDIAGKVAIVNGASRGIGRRVSERLLEAGALVATCSRSELEHPPAAREGEASDLERTFHRACDQRRSEEIEAFVDEAVARFGRIDILINNAGGSPYQETATASEEFHRSNVENNLLGPMLFSIGAYRKMSEQSSVGSIINISSIASSSAGAPAGLVSYGAAKAGLNQLTRSLAKEWAPRVRVNCLILGLIDTENLRREAMPDEAAREAFVAAVPMGRIGEADEVADACFYLCSPSASYITGAALTIDGGFG
jgi:NAD(P)-dependent dehydrogenase (short-subunit alcohol dehydrogenase family)